MLQENADKIPKNVCAKPFIEGEILFRCFVINFLYKYWLINNMQFKIKLKNEGLWNFLRFVC